MTKKIRAVLVDDESLARRFLRRLLSDDPDIEIVGEGTDGREAIALIRKEQPDLVFLDVQMPEIDGFAVIENLKDEYLPQIVFTTAYEQYAIKAFELHALDYLLKPFDQIRFADMLKHAKEQLVDRQIDQDRRQLEALLGSVKQQPEYLDRLIIKGDGRITFIKVAEINWLRADDKYVQLHIGKTTCTVRQTLSSMESQLDRKRFVRIHRSVIVNVDRIKELQPLFGGEHVIVLDDGTKLTLSRNYKNRLFERLGKPL